MLARRTLPRLQLTQISVFQISKRYSSMNAEEKYLFDLNGFIVLRGVFESKEVEDVNNIIDKHEHEFQERTKALRNTEFKSPLSGDGATGRRDLGRILEWGEDSKFFREVLTHPKLIPYYNELLGRGYRMDHLPFVISQSKGSEGFALHGGTLDAMSGEYNPHLAYSCVNGKIHNQLLAVSVILSDHHEGDGGFVIVRGSHKANFPVPLDMIHDRKYSEFLYQPITKAGDVILFSEGTVHGARAWTSESRRRIALYRLAPPTACYSKSYYPSWPSSMLDGMTEAQRAVLEPPYALRLERPFLEEGNSVSYHPRAEYKKTFDQKVFGKASF